MNAFKQYQASLLPSQKRYTLCMIDPVLCGYCNQLSHILLLLLYQLTEQKLSECKN